MTMADSRLHDRPFDVRIEEYFTAGANQCMQDEEDKIYQRECAYPVDSLARHWWSRGYAYQARAFRAVAMEARIRELEAQLAKQKAEFEARILGEHNLRQEENAVHDREMEELEAQLAEANATIAHLRKAKDCYYDCVDKAEANRRIATAQEAAMDTARPLVEKAEADAARLRADTVEECAKIVEAAITPVPERNSQTIAYRDFIANNNDLLKCLAEEIRALSPDARQPESVDAGDGTARSE